MDLLTLHDIEMAGKRLLVRVDFNVPLRDDGKVASDWRIRAALPTLQEALDRNAALVLMSHLGRPGGSPHPRLSLRPVAARLQQLLSRPVRHTKDVTGAEARRLARALQPGEILLLENLRFDPREKAGDETFADALGAMGDCYVNDAFAACHRQDASLFQVPERFPGNCRVIGRLVERELAALVPVREDPRQPLVAVLGGAKVKDKIEVVKSFLERSAIVYLGGVMALTFLRAKGTSIGASRWEETAAERARTLLQQAGDRIVLPVDHVLERDGDTRGCGPEIPDGWRALDVGPETLENVRAGLRDAATVVWNGPWGKFEEPRFSRGTNDLIDALTLCEGTTVAGGGETATAVETAGMMERFDHVSTGGGAFLTYLATGTLPALAALDQQERAAAPPVIHLKNHDQPS